MTAPHEVLRPATAADKILYKNLYNLYQNDLSVLGADSFTCVDDQGYFAADTVREIFPPDANILPFVISPEGQNVGLLLLTCPPYPKMGADYCIEDFYLLACRRGTGLAQDVLREIFRKYPGSYYLEVFCKNPRARNFWLHTLPVLAHDIRQHPVDARLLGITFHT